MGLLKIDKPIRLIELFAGIGSQAKALKRLGADFEHYRICEFDKYAIKSYNAIHGTDFVTSDITEITAKDLGIVDTDKYTYICCYSFPCQDLSLAGKQKLMAKGSGTRSSLLWEVERLLNECEELPQILLMENVTQVHGKKNKEHFDEWIAFLESKGYKNYWKDLNAKNFGIPQNRNRTFMVSVLGDYTYEFPKEFPLELRLKDMLEDSVDEKFYLSDKMISFFTENTKRQQEKGNGFRFQPTDGSGIGKAVTTRAGGRMDDNFIEEQPILIGGMQKNQSVKTDGISTTLTSSMGMGGGYVPMVVAEPCIKQVAQMYGTEKEPNPQAGRIYDADGISPTLDSCSGGNRMPKVADPTPIRIGNIYGERFGTSMAGNVWEKEAISPAIMTSQGGNRQPLITEEPKVVGGTGEKESNGGTQWYQQDRVYDNNIAISVTTGFNPYYKVNEPFIVASRGRNPENPSDRTAGIPLEQRLEPNFSGCANTLTTVQKDNYVAEPQVLRAERTEYGKAIRKQYESGELYEKIGNMREMKPRTDGVSNTITTVQKDNYICEPMVRKIGNIYHSGGQNGNIYDSEGLSPTLLSGETSTKGNGGIGSSNAPKITEPEIAEPYNLRIRKLTPKECWRLMGFDDEDFEKAAAVNSNTQLYKQAGNSIVVDVLCYIFGEML